MSNVTITKYEIKPNLNKITAVKFLNDCILTGQRKGYNDFRIILSTNQRTYPNICAPIAGIINYYEEKGFNFDFYYESSYYDYLKHTLFDKPLEAEKNTNSIEMAYPLDKVWKYETSQGVNALVTAYITSVRQTAVLGEGVIKGLEWCINESMDNVLQHSRAKYGFVMGQLQPTSHRLSFCIFDTGIGIYNSLKNSKHRPVKEIDAITIALQERITRDTNIGQGNGMWGLSEIVLENGGSLRISSCGAVLDRQGNNIRTISNGDFNLGKSSGTTFVDFQLDYSRKIDVAKALNGYEPIDLWLENLEDDSGNYIIEIAKESSGTGTRQSAQKIRNIVINIIKETHKKVTLDFRGVSILSSSFSDELIGKLIVELGFIFFVQAITLKNITDVNVSIVNRSIGQRMAQHYLDENIIET